MFSWMISFIRMLLSFIIKNIIIFLTDYTSMSDYILLIPLVNMWSFNFNFFNIKN